MQDGGELRVGGKLIYTRDIQPSYSDEMAAVMRVAKAYYSSPDDVLNKWSYHMFLDCCESLHVEAEINRRINESLYEAD